MTTTHHRGGEAAPIGHLIQRLERELRLGEPRPLTDFGDPRELKTRVIRALSTVRRLDPGALGVTRAQLRHLIELVGCTARDDLAASGGFLGGSNGYYASRLSVEPATVTTIFRALRKAGLVEAHNATANHRRSCHRKPDGLRDGRGYSLRPTVERIEEIEALAARLEAECNHMAAMLFEIRALIAEAGGIASALPSPSPAITTAIDELRIAARRLKPTSPIGHGRDLLTRVSDLRNALRTQLKTALASQKNRDQTGKKSRQHHTDEQASLVIVSAWREGSSGDHRTHTRPDELEARPGSMGSRSGANLDGDLSCGLTLKEARLLFPETHDYIPATDTPDEAVTAATALSYRLRINPRLLARSLETMGVTRTLWSLHLVHHRMSNGQIERDPAAYFNGMVSRAVKGQLDIDRSIWGMRSAAT